MNKTNIFTMISEMATSSSNSTNSSNFALLQQHSNKAAVKKKSTARSSTNADEFVAASPDQCFKPHKKYLKHGKSLSSRLQSSEEAKYSPQNGVNRDNRSGSEFYSHNEVNKTNMNNMN